MSGLAVLLCCVCALASVLAAKGQEAGLSFEAIGGAENGGKAILDKREAEVREKMGKKAGEGLGHAWWLWGLSNIDYDNDGDQDLVVAIHGAGGNGLILKNQFRETGSLTFADVTKELGVDGMLPSADWNPAIWDFDGDGFLDIAGLFNDQPTLSLLNREGKGFVKAPFHFHPLNKGPHITDLNGDGCPDVYYHGAAKLTFLFDPAGKTFKRVSEPNEAPSGVGDELRSEIVAVLKSARFTHPSFHTEHDINGDGLKDLVIGVFSSYGGPRRGWYLLADKDGKFTESGQSLGLPPAGTPFHFQDLSGSGAVDILVAASPEGGFYRNDGKGRFALVPGQLTAFLKRGESYLQRVFSVDFDNDGDIDLLVSNRRGGSARVFENRGEGVFRQALDAGGWDADPVVVRDMDEDGRMDVVVGGRKNELTVYLNRTANTGAWLKILPHMESPNPFAVDARVEVFAAGALGRADAKPLFAGPANPDGTFVHAGLGQAAAVDLRVTFPGGQSKTAEGRNLAANTKWKATPDGKVQAVER